MKKSFVLFFALILSLCILSPAAADEMVTVTFDTKIPDHIFQNSRYRVEGKRVDLPVGETVRFTMGGDSCIQYSLTGRSGGEAFLSGRTLSIRAGSEMTVRMKFDLAACFANREKSKCTQWQKLLGTCSETSSIPTTPYEDCMYLFNCAVVKCEEACEDLDEITR